MSYPTDLYPIEGICKEILDEYERAVDKFAPYNSAHEGWAVIKEELDELWDEVRLKEHDRGAMRKEAIQIATTAIRFIKDVCDMPMEKR